MILATERVLKCCYSFPTGLTVSDCSKLRFSKKKLKPHFYFCHKNPVIQWLVRKQSNISLSDVICKQ
jgi:hypothetical protein